MLCYATIRRWVGKFGPIFARELRRRRPRPSATWHLDEMVVRIGGERFWIWRAVDHEGEVLDMLVQRRRGFAREVGADEGELLMPHAERAWQRWFEENVSDADKAGWPNRPLADLCRHAIDPEIGRDTTIFLAQGGGGEIAAATSTSGWGWKYPGRLGDSPVVGAGFYADTRYGAAACTGVGEMTIRCGTARAFVLYMKRGATVEEAVREAAEDMRSLGGGLIGRVTIHAIDARDGHKVLAVNGTGRETYWLWQGGSEPPESRGAEVVVIAEAAGRQTASSRYADLPL